MNVALASFATSRPKTVYAIVVFLTVVLGSMITGIQIDTDPESMLAETQSDRVYHNEIEKRFSISDAIVVGVVNEDHPDGIYNVRSLAALHALSEEILKLDGVVALDLMSIAQADNLTQEGPGTIRFEWLMKDAPQTQEQALEIRDKIEQLPLLMNSLVAGDGKAATIYVPIEEQGPELPPVAGDFAVDERARFRRRLSHHRSAGC